MKSRGTGFWPIFPGLGRGRRPSARAWAACGVYCYGRRARHLTAVVRSAGHGWGTRAGGATNPAWLRTRGGSVREG